MYADPADAALASAEISGSPPPIIAKDEGGQAVISREWKYFSSAVITHHVEPVPGLINFSRRIQVNYSEFVPRAEQFLGTLTTPVEQSPVSYRLKIKIYPITSWTLI